MVVMIISHVCAQRRDGNAPGWKKTRLPLLPLIIRALMNKNWCFFVFLLLAWTDLPLNSQFAILLLGLDNAMENVQKAKEIYTFSLFTSTPPTNLMLPPTSTNRMSPRVSQPLLCP